MEFILKFKNYLLAQKNTAGISKNGASKATVKNYLADVKHFINWVESTYKKPFSPEDITIQTINEFKMSKTQELSASSIERHISTLRKFFSFLKLNGNLSHSPFEEIATHQQALADPWHLHDFKNYLYVYNASHLTIKNYIIDVRQFLSWAEEVLAIHNAWKVQEKDVLKRIDNTLIDEYKQRLLHQHIFSPSSINRKLSSLRKYLAWAGEQGYLTQDARLKIQDVRSVDSMSQSVENNFLPGNVGTRGDARSGRPEAGVQTEEDQGKSITYSKVPPIRLIQRLLKASTFTFDLLITTPVAFLFRNIEHQQWKLTGKKVFFSDAAYKIGNLKPLTTFKFKIKNYSKEFIAPLSISTQDYPWYKKALHHMRYTRPQWYRKYHQLAIAQYFNWAVLIIFATAIGFGGYNAFFTKPSKSLAALPNQPIRVLSFQGRLTDANNNPISSPSWIRFIIYNTQSSSSSARLWEEVDKVTPDQDGIFSLLLGSDGLSDGGAAALCNSGNPPTSPATGACGIPQSLFANNNALWLGVTVEATSELTPREQLATVAFASNSETLQGLPPITQSGAGTNNVVLALNSSGNLSIGASTTFQSTSGQFTLSGNTVAINTNTGTNGNISLAPDGLGTIDLQRPLQNSTNNGNISSIPNALEVDDLFGILATSSGQSAFTINQNGAGPIISASASGNAKFTLQNDGTVILPKYNAADGVLFINDTAGTVNETAQGASHTFLRGNGASAPTFNAIDLSTADVSNVLTVDKGGLGANLSGSAAVGDILYADTTTTFHRLAVGTSSQCLIGGTTPSWSSCSNASNNYWQLNAKVVSPADLNNDLAIGGNSTSSAKFQVFAETVGVDTAGQASTSAGLTFADASGTNPIVNILNGNTLTFKTSPGGDSGSGYSNAFLVGPNAIQFYSSSNQITNAGALTIASNLTVNGTTATFGGGSTATLQTSSNAGLNLNTGSGILTLNNGGTGNIQFFSNANTIDSSGNLTVNGTGTFKGASVTVGNGSTATIGSTNAALNLNSGSGVLTLNNGGSGNIDFFSTANVLTSGGNLSLNGTLALNQGAAAATKTNVDSSGNVLPGTDGGANLGASGTAWNTLFVKNIQVPITGGLGGYWQLSSGATTYGVLAPTNIQNDLAIGGNSTSSAKFQVFGQTNGVDIAGSASTSANFTFADAAGTNPLINILNGNSLVLKTSPGGDSGTGYATALTIGPGGTLTDAAYTIDQGILFTNTSGVLKQTAAPGSSGLCLVSAASGNTPTWTSCSAAASNFWQLNGPVLSPSDLNNDLAIGGNSTSSAKFQVFAETVGVAKAGSASTSANLTFADASGTNPIVNILNGNTLTFKTSPGGDSGSGYSNAFLVGPNAIQFYSSSNQITNAGALTIASNLTVNGTSITVGNGSTSTIGTTNAALSLNSGTQTLTLNNGGSGTIQFFSNSNTLDQNGNLTLAGNITLSANSGNSITSVSNFAQFSNGISVGGSTTNQIDKNGNAVLNTLRLPITGGIGGYWNLTSSASTYGLLFPSNVQNDLAIGGTATASAANTSIFQVFANGVNTQPAATASTSGNFTFRNTSGTNMIIDYLNGTNLVFKKSPGGDAGLATILTLDNAGNVTVANNLSVNGSIATSLIPTSNTLNLGSVTNNWGTLFATNLALPITGGQDGYWQLSSGATKYGVLSPTNIQNDLAIGGTATSSAVFQIFGQSYLNDLGTVPAGTATMAGNLVFRGTAGAQTAFQSDILNGASLGFYNSTGGDIGVTSVYPTLYLASGSATPTVGIGTNNPQGVLDIASQGNLFPSDFILNQVSATNLVANPSFENHNFALNFWTFNRSPEFAATDTATESALFGATALRMNSSRDAGSTFTATSQCIPVLGSKTFTASGFINATAGFVGNIGMNIQTFTTRDCAGSSSTVGRVNTTVTGKWTRVTSTISTASTVLGLEVQWIADNSSHGIAYLDGVQLEQNGTATPYLDGSLGPGYVWDSTGSPNATDSSRMSGAAFAYQTLNSANGIGATSGGNQPTLQLDQDGTQDIIAASHSGVLQFQVTTNGNIIARKFTDLDNEIYYLDPAGLTTSASLAGSMTFTPASEHDINYLNGSALNFRRSAGGDGTNGANFTSSMYLDNSGNVGIDTTSPSQPLDVNGNAIVEGTTLFVGGTTFTVKGNASASNLYALQVNRSGGTTYTLPDVFGITTGLVLGGTLTGGGTIALNTTAGSTPTMYLTGTTVGINTTNPLVALQVAGSASESGDLTFYNSSNATTHNIYAFNGGNLDFQVSPGGTVPSTGLTHALYIQQGTGNIGLGTTSPSQQLDILGGTATHFTFNASTSTSGYTTAFSMDNTGFKISGNSSSRDIELATNSSTGIKLDGTGNVFVDVLNAAGYTHAVCKSAANGGLLELGTCTTAGTGDFAENIVAPNTDQGDIISLDPAFSTEQTNNTTDHQTTYGIKSTTAYDAHLLGGISVTGFGYESPAFKDIAVDPSSWREIALVGVIPIKVSTLNGPIHQGDPITSSEIPGIGMKATKAGIIIGKAVEDFNSAQATQAARLINKQWQLTNGSCQPEEVNCYNEGKVLTMTNTSWYDPDVYLTDTGDAQTIDQTPNVDFTIPHYYALTDALRQPITRVEELAQLAVGSIRAGVVNSQQVVTNSLAIATDNVSIAGQSLRDYIATIVSQVVTNQSSLVTSPVASIDQLHTNLVSPLASNSAIALDLSENSKLNVKNTVSQKTVASIDNNGNATFSGNLNSQNLAVNGDATVSGTLYANNIKANSIEGLSEVVSTLSAQNITNVTNIFFATPSATSFAENTSTGSNANSSSSSGAPDSVASSGLASSSTTYDLRPMTNYASIASYSSYFAYVPNLKAETGLFNQGLVSLGPTSLTDTSITGQLSIGGQLILADTSINVLGSDFAIQPLRQGGVNFEGGLIAIDTNGNLSVNGNATIKGNLAVGTISPLAAGKDVNVNLPNDSSFVHTSQFLIHNASNSAVFAVNQLGDLVASGTATFNKLNLSLAQPALALSDTEVVATGSAGTARINAFQREVTIDNPNVTANSLIYITPVGTDQTPYLERQVAGTSFTVGIPTDLPQAVNFNWLIVN